MLTFSVNPSEERKAEINIEFMQKEKPVNDYERVGMSEAYFKRIEGRLTEDVNIEAYGYKITVNNRMMKGKKEVPIIEQDKFNNQPHGVLESFISSADDDDIDQLIDMLDTDINNIIKEFNNFVEHLILYEGVNFEQVLKKALTGDFKAINRLKELMIRYKKEDLIHTILTNDEIGNILELRKTIERNALSVSNKDEIAIEEREGLINKYVSEAWRKYDKKRSVITNG